MAQKKGEAKVQKTDVGYQIIGKTTKKVLKAEKSEDKSKKKKK